MIYKHKYFNLDVRSRRVFDENSKELRLTGNAYRVLFCLCENGPSTVTDIGDSLDRAKDYEEDHIRQYRYKINSIIGHDVVKYENKVYSIDGNVEKIEKNDIEKGLILEKNDRNTDLLRKEEYNKNKKTSILKKIFKLRLFWFIIAVLIIVVILAVFYGVFKPKCNIKGNINVSGEKIYHTPNCQDYDQTIINPDKGERWFCSEKDAQEAGWRKALNCNK